MKASILLPYEALNAPGCCRLHARHAAITSAVYTLNISILVVLLYSWRIGVNVKKYADLEDVYYGVQMAYCATIGTQLFMVVLSIVLLFGIFKENSGLVVPWIIGFITFMALEAVAMVYSNVLRDHVNRVGAIYGVMQFYNMLRAGISWKEPEAIEL
ncbi:uncharacterized protein LOC111864982 isoform X2 [Cryptotermes secundus]|uniref:uncharacterized protein LOC111864982 isoform X2 n=1 Tax=Cryptotermes secundus TaxID=105785 RepID=UPI000CD7B2BC|nr:uncharacterized protein LOC111864982 isoform X2 [Cryptotermes secundus]